MKYIVVELQTYANGTIGNLVDSYDSRLEAESKYHTVLAAAAVSELPYHAAVLINNRGELLESWSYTHQNGE